MFTWEQYYHGPDCPRCGRRSMTLSKTSASVSSLDRRPCRRAVCRRTSVKLDGEPPPQPGPPWDRGADQRERLPTRGVRGQELMPPELGRSTRAPGTCGHHEGFQLSDHPRREAADHGLRQRPHQKAREQVAGREESLDRQNRAALGTGHGQPPTEIWCANPPAGASRIRAKPATALGPNRGLLPHGGPLTPLPAGGFRLQGGARFPASPDHFLDTAAPGVPVAGPGKLRIVGQCQEALVLRCSVHIGTQGET
jgi:hypothetical protein